MLIVNAQVVREPSEHLKRAFESGLSLIYIGIHEVSKIYWMPLACTLNVCMSFPGVMQGDNENIQMNLVFAPCSQLNRFYCCIGLKSDMALYNNARNILKHVNMSRPINLL